MHRGDLRVCISCLLLGLGADVCIASQERLLLLLDSDLSGLLLLHEVVGYRELVLELAVEVTGCKIEQSEKVVLSLPHQLEDAVQTVYLRAP